MPPAADAQPKPLKRHRRKTKTSSISQSYPNGLPEDRTPYQLSSDLDLPEQETEPNPPTMFVRQLNHHLQGQPNAPAEENVKRTQTPRKKKGSPPNTSSPTPKRNSTPRPIHRTISLTPGKKSTTPSQAYAGPTFHASPAASSLPMPRFFSKSVPEIDKTPSMQLAIDKETTEESSEQSEESPTPVFASRIGEEQAREQSPLDIFFRADRVQKQRLREEQRASPGTQRVSNHLDLERPRNHSRHSTNGSTGGVFSMDLESKEEPIQASHEKSFSDPVAGTVGTNYPKPSPSARAIETPQEAEQRRAKTIALKKFLLSSTTSPEDLESEPGHSSVSDDPPVGRNQSPQQAKTSTGPQIFKHLAAENARQISPCPRPPSNLRKEISASAVPDSEAISELPATPTPSRTRNAYRSAPLQGVSTAILDGASSSPAQLPSKHSTPASTTVVSSSPYKSMEDDLRRILKLEVLSNDSATGVPS
ncbi:MAG: hypothetical protein Q9184_002420 [Pyrenodesmia sp. 2 TL-2023]